ncbi:unnamed protein product [Hymenolepis diminuta]|uniref:Non-specific serine/threonine protein kinase n=1 Tax=Hymenolepis diminuta TaxID=6216 RepID=A0A0R3SVQ0_HYMDI|nr:unnamed protein product [Hymenolepis diminuta]
MPRERSHREFIRAATKKQKYERIYEKKLATTPEQLCRGYAVEFETYLQYARELVFEAPPDYLFLRRLFRKLFKTYDFAWDSVYDWTLMKQKPAALPSSSHQNANAAGGTACNNTTAGGNQQQMGMLPQGATGDANYRRQYVEDTFNNSAGVDYSQQAAGQGSGPGGAVYKDPNARF